MRRSTLPTGSPGAAGVAVRNQLDAGDVQEGND